MPTNITAAATNETKKVPLSKTVILVDFRWAWKQYMAHVKLRGGIQAFNQNGVHVQFDAHKFVGVMVRAANMGREKSDPLWISLDSFNQVHFFWAHHDPAYEGLSPFLEKQALGDVAMKTWLYKNNPAILIEDGERGEFDVIQHMGQMRKRMIYYLLQAADLRNNNLDVGLPEGIRRRLIGDQNIPGVKVEIPIYHEKNVDADMGAYIHYAADYEGCRQILIASGDADFRRHLEFAVGQDPDGFMPAHGPKNVTIVTNSDNRVFNLLDDYSSLISVRRLTPDLMDSTLKESEFRPDYRRPRRAS